MTEKRLDFIGAHQTCYSDWARSVLEFYPYNPRFKTENKDIVAVFYNNDKIAEYNFETGKGFIIEKNKKHDLSKIEQLPQFQEIEIDRLIQV